MGESLSDLKEKLMVAKTSLAVLKSTSTGKSIDGDIQNQSVVIEISLRNMLNLDQLEQFMWTNIERMRKQSEEVKSIITLLHEAEATDQRIDDS